MKKLSILVFSLFVGCLSVAFSDEKTLPDVNSEYIGTYFPVDIENSLKFTKLFYKSLNLGYPIHHDVLYLGKNICYSDVHFHDGYAIDAKDFKNYRFVTNENGTFCIDQNGNSYKKIASALEKNGYSYNSYAEHVTKTLLDFAKDMKNIQIKNDTLTIDNISYNIILDGMFLETKNVAICLRNNNDFYALVKNGFNGELHKEIDKDGERWYSIDSKVIKEFPLMFVPTENELSKDFNLPKEQYRYLRNLVYAKHGYIFKSEDLKSFFEKFNWYKPNPNFSESEFTFAEKQYVKSMLEQEKN